MPKRSSNKHRDFNEIASEIVGRAVGDIPQDDPPEAQENSGKNQAAVELGRLGGKKGGPARAAALSKRRRSEIAKKAAKARWRRQKPT